MSCISGPVTRPCGLVTHERNETISQLQHLIDVNLFVIVLGSTCIRNEAMKLNFICLWDSSCPCCHSQWPDDRWKWAQPGLYFGTFHHMENRNVTFCTFSCENPLYCPPSSLASEYDARLFPDIEATPSCKVIDDRMGLTWFWKVRQADRLTRLKHFVSLLGVVLQ